MILGAREVDLLLEEAHDEMMEVEEARVWGEQLRLRSLNSDSQSDEADKGNQMASALEESSIDLI